MSYRVEYFQSGTKHVTEYSGDIKDLRKVFREDGKTVVRVTKRRTQLGLSIKRDEIIAALTALGDLLSTGEPITKSFDTVEVSLAADSKLRPILHTIADSLRSGKSLSVAVDPYAHVFGTTVLAMLAAGEESGKLGQAMLSAADYLSHMNDIRGEIIKKLLYPVTVLLISMLSLLINSTVIIPRLLKSGMFKILEKSGKSSTSHLVFLKLMTITSKAVPITFLLLIIGVVGLFWFFKFNQKQAELLIIRIPWLKALIFSRAYYIGFSSLSNLTSVGVRLDIAFEIVARSTKLLLPKREFEAAQQALKDGISFTTGLKSLTPVDKVMLDTAQNVGRIQKNFERISTRFYNQYLDRVRSLGPKIYTVAVCFVAVVFLMMFFGIMVPYFESMRAMGK